MTTPVRSFIDLNKRFSARLGKRLPQARDDLFARYDRTVAEHVRRLPDSSIVVDVGGGRTCSFASQIDERDRGRVRLIGVDVSEEELRHNSVVDETRVADVAKGLPFEDASVAMVVSRTVLEHVEDVRAFVGHASRVLVDGGVAIHLVPCRNAPFAVLARVIPFHIAKAALHFMRPESIGHVEFPVFYDQCTYSEMRDIHLRAGFRSVEGIVSYYQSEYFDALFPAFALSAAYELLIQRYDARDLAAYALVIATK